MKQFISTFFLLMASLSLQAAVFDHDEWSSLLQKHVVPINKGVATQVDYGGFARDRFRLRGYLKSLESISQSNFERWPREEQLAFLINAYNAWTIELILTQYPTLESIKDLGSWIESPWDKSFIPLLGKTRSLDEIEHGLIRGEGRFREPRIHFAVNCASIGCPALAATAYTGEQLVSQLDEATRLFLSDRSRNRLTGDRLYLSKIFKWYRDDFERGWGGYRRLEKFLADYSDALGLNESDVRRLNSGDIDIEFLDYDWALNRKR